MKAGGVYAYRTWKPAARLRIPFLSSHWGYVGRTSSFYHRHLQHTRGVSQFGREEAKPWSDLVIRCYRIGLPNWQWLHVAVEALVIWTLFPVYNVKLNRWNPRRIPLRTARRQRLQRDHGHRWPDIRPVHIGLVIATTICAWYMIAKWGL